MNEAAPGSTAITLLAADGPVEEPAEKLMLFGRFVGAWDVGSERIVPSVERRWNTPNRLLAFSGRH